MVNAFNSIYKATGGNKAALIKLLGSVEAFNAVLSLTGGDVKNTYLKALDDMKNGGDTLTEAYNKQMGGFNNQMEALKNKFQVLGIQLGEALLPAINEAMPSIQALADSFINNLPAIQADVTPIFWGIATVTKLVADNFEDNEIILK